MAQSSACNGSRWSAFARDGTCVRTSDGPMLLATITREAVVRNRLSAAVSVALESVSTPNAMARPWSTSPLLKLRRWPAVTRMVMSAPTTPIESHSRREKNCTARRLSPDGFGSVDGLHDGSEVVIE